MRIVYIIINLNPKKKKQKEQKELLIKLTADSFCKNLIIDLFENYLHHLLTKTKLMKKKLSLFLVAFLAAMAYAATTTWKVTGDAGQTSINAGTTLIDADALTVRTVYATTLKNDAPTIEGESFTKAITIRTDGYPTADNLTGTEKQGSTSLIVTVKQDCDVTLYYRHQSSNTQKEKGVDPETGDEIDVITSVTHVENDSKDLIVFDQAEISTKMSGKVNFYGNELDEYKYATKKVSLKKDHVYTITASGTTLQFYGLTYETEETDYYLVGSMNGWKINDDYKLKANLEAEGEYMITLDLKAKDALKIQGSDKKWYPDGMDNDYVIKEDGNYTIYFRPAGNNDWGNGFFYVAKNETTEPEPTNPEEGEAQATTTTFDFTSSDFISGLGLVVPETSKTTYIQESVTYDKVTLTPIKCSSNWPAIYNSNGVLSFRIYKLANDIKGGAQFSVSNGTVDKIVITGDTQLQNVIADNGTIEMSTDNKTLTWTKADGESPASVTFLHGGSKTLAINTIDVTKTIVGGDIPETTYGIVGDLTGGWETDAEMKKDVGAEGVYTLVVEGFEAKAGEEYKYKLILYQK